MRRKSKESKKASEAIKVSLTTICELRKKRKDTCSLEDNLVDKSTEKIAESCGTFFVSVFLQLAKIAFHIYHGYYEFSNANTDLTDLSHNISKKLSYLSPLPYLNVGFLQDVNSKYQLGYRGLIFSLYFVMLLSYLSTSLVKLVFPSVLKMLFCFCLVISLK